MISVFYQLLNQLLWYFKCILLCTFFSLLINIIYSLKKTNKCKVRTNTNESLNMVYMGHVNGVTSNASCKQNPTLFIPKKKSRNVKE